MNYCDFHPLHKHSHAKKKNRTEKQKEKQKQKNKKQNFVSFEGEKKPPKDFVLLPAQQNLVLHPIITLPSPNQRYTTSIQEPRPYQRDTIATPKNMDYVIPPQRTEHH